MLSLSFLRYFQKNLVIKRMFKIIENKKFWKIEKIEYSGYRIVPFYDHLHLENYMLYNSLLKLINFYGFL